MTKVYAIEPKAVTKLMNIMLVITAIMVALTIYSWVKKDRFEMDHVQALKVEESINFYLKNQLIMVKWDPEDNEIPSDTSTIAFWMVHHDTLYFMEGIDKEAIIGTRKWTPLQHRNHLWVTMKHGNKFHYVYYRSADFTKAQVELRGPAVQNWIDKLTELRFKWKGETII